MATSHFDFVNVVVADRNLMVTSSHAHACRLEPRESDLAWYCDLDDGTPTGENDPASSVRWVCPALRVGQPAIETAVLLDVRRSGPHSDLGRLMKGFSRLIGRTSRDTPGADDIDGRLVYTDPTGILDVALRRRIENWPSVRHQDGVVRPELWSIKLTREGLVVLSVSWWDDAAALDHQIGLAVDIALRLRQQR